MHPEETRRVEVTMQNTGVEAWDSTDFRLQSTTFPEDRWGESTYLLIDGETINPDEMKTFIVYLEAPAVTAPGGETFPCQWQMKKNSVFDELFGEIVEKNIWVDESVDPEWDAIITENTIPDALYPGEPRLITVTVENTGTVNWEGDRFAIRSNPIDLWDTDAYYHLGDTEIVAPGEERTFNAIITAPSPPEHPEGIYDSNWQMLHIHTWTYFGQLYTKPVNVSSSVVPGLLAVPTGNTIPDDIYPEDTQSVTITFRNDGSETWTEDTVRLYAPTGTWGERVYTLNPGETIAQGASKTFNIILEAPGVEDTYDCEWWMQRIWDVGEGPIYVSIGEFVKSVNVTTSATPFLNAIIVDNTIPAQMNVDATQPVTVTVENTGSGTWDGSDTVNWMRLFSRNSPVDLWVTREKRLDASDVILPGEQKVFTFNITAPSVPAFYQCSWQMQKKWPGGQLSLFGGLVDETVQVGDVDCTDHSECAECMKCEDNVCVVQSEGEDLKDECDGLCATGTCDGAGDCGYYPDTTECRGSGGDCDIAETCTGSDKECPADAKSTAVCRDIQGDCDIAESCNGIDNDCPADAFEPDTTECRASAGDCDVAETCTGSSASCPDDEYQPADTPCGDTTVTDCDEADTCDGVGVCLDNLVEDGTACGDFSDTECDNPDTCLSGTCEENYETAGADCGDQGVVCHEDDTCDGAGSCTDNGFTTNGTACGDYSDTECDNPDS